MLDRSPAEPRAMFTSPRPIFSAAQALPASKAPALSAARPSTTLGVSSDKAVKPRAAAPIPVASASVAGRRASPMARSESLNA
ncbi:hypothetical protein D3C87_1841990 [compost metagenome]